MNKNPWQALRCPPARGWRRSAASIPENMRARMAADEARAWSHSAAAGALWESGWRLSRAIAAAEKIAPPQNNCCNPPENAGESPRCQHGNPAPAGCLEPLENTKMKITTEKTDPRRELCKMIHEHTGERLWAVFSATEGSLVCLEAGRTKEEMEKQYDASRFDFFRIR